MVDQLPRSKWLIPLNGFQERVRLYVYPYAGGGAATFRTWRDRLPPWFSLQLIQLAGRENRFSETPARSSEEITMAVASAIASKDDIPVVLFGHSMGALLAFDLARELRRRHGRSPAALIVSGAPAPQLARRTPRLAHLDNRQLLKEVNAMYGAIPQVALDDDELADVMVRVLKSDLNVVEGYRYLAESPLDLPVAAFGGADDPWVTSTDLNAWREQTGGAFHWQIFGGDHFYLRTPEGERLLLTQIRSICSSVCGLS